MRINQLTTNFLSRSVILVHLSIVYDLYSKEE
jgi:hypothetical protein